MTMPTTDASPVQQLLALFEPLLASIAAAGEPVDEAAAARVRAALEQAWPVTHPRVAELHASLREGIAAGWLCERGEPDARFGRLAKSTPTSHDHSIDLVCLRGAGMAHGHPRGEITLALPATDADVDARFDGAAPGWIVSPAGSAHVPTVTGGTMILLYALPGGAVAWNVA